MARTPDKSREIKLRRAADRQGLRLQKSPRRDPFALGYETYRIADPRDDGRIVAGDREFFGLDLDQVEDALTKDLPARRSQEAGR